MKIKNTCRLFLVVSILIFSILFTSCANLGWATVMPQLNINKQFENSAWLVIDNLLINKNDGSVCVLSPNKDATILGIDNIYYHGPYTYKIEFEDDTFKLYTFLQANYYSKESNEFIYVFYDCVFIYNYKGCEVNRMYLSDALTKEQAVALYELRFDETEAFSYEIDILWENHKDENKSEAQQQVLEFIENLYGNSSKRIKTITGNAKIIDDEIWFSVNLFPNTHFNSGDALVSGIKRAEIKSYNPGTGEFQSVYKHNKKNEAIVDFDKNGFYTFDSDSNLKYFDIDSNKSTLIYTFPYRMPETTHAVYSFDITDNYICVSYEDGEKGHYYLVYKKSEGIIANSLYYQYTR